MKVLGFILTLFIAASAFGRLSDGKATFTVKDGKIVGAIQKGFHFNKEAPAAFVMKGAEIAPLVKEESQLIFAMPAKENEPFELGFYVCDDKKTVCEEHKITYMLSAGKLKSASEVKKADLAKPEVKASTGKVHKNHHGFIENDLEAAKVLAAKSKKNLLVDYGAPWCPACVRLETEVFGTKAFKSVTKDFILVALNADMTVNKSFGKQYNIKAIPTVLILKPDGTELYRALDFAPADIYAQRIKDAKKNLQSAADLEKLAQAGDQKAIETLAENAYNALDMESSVKWYRQIDSQSDRFASAETSMAAKKARADKKTDEYFAILKKWADLKPQSFTGVTATNEWAEFLQNEKKELPADLKERLKANCEFLQNLTKSKADTVKWVAAWDVSPMAPVERAEALSMWKTSAEALGQKEEVVKIQKELQEEVRSLKLSEKRPGEVMATLYYFRQAGLPEIEESWLLKLEKADPNSYVPHMKLANYYVRNKAYEKALPQAKLAVELGEDLRLHNLQTLAEIQKELKQKDEAKKTIEIALAHPEVKEERFKEVLKSLEQLKKDL
ncbi:thioredoxin family protein [Bdellovibrio bacteriovorus]|uniref:thioredoxin family protein n=1 Tax=Bdellovibrio bacteriovorus TaxID=959 RepID=UPI003AA80EB3